MEIVKLTFTSPLHLSKGKSTYEDSFKVLHADTLKSALFVCALELFGKEEIDKSFLESFLLSSAFPYTEDELFFPKPERFSNNFTIKDPEKNAKELKKVNFVGQSYFEKMLCAEVCEVEKKDIVGEKFLSEKKKMPYRAEITQRVSISRNDADQGNTFYTDRIFLNEKCGFYFILKIKQGKEAFRAKIEAALRLLGDHGLGSDKSVGNGQFEFKIEQFDLKMPTENEATHQVSMSLYLPKKAEIENLDLEKSAYQLTKRGGYIANPENVNHASWRKKSVYMFKEGAVFPKADLLGDIVDLQPNGEGFSINHPIYRDGQSIFFNCKML